MDDEQQGEHNVLLAWILGIAVAVAIAVSLITGILAGLGGGAGGSAGAALTGAGPAAGASGGAPAATLEVDVAPALASGPGYPEPVRLHFDTAKSELPPDATAQLAAIVEWARAQASARVGISGFHDARGDAAANAILARNRAVAARDALVAAGVPVDRIVLVRPRETTGGADDREARRVEVYPAQ